MHVESSTLKMDSPCELRSTLTQDVCMTLRDSMSAYPHSYDEVFTQAGDRIRANGYVSKIDISALSAWKRLNLNAQWMESLQELPDADLIRTSRNLFLPNLSIQDRITRFWESEIPGFTSGTFAVASTVLSAWNPMNFGITDWRTRNQLAELSCTCGPRINKYSIYLAHLHFIREEMNSSFPERTWSCRNVDVMLFSRRTR